MLIGSLFVLGVRVALVGLVVQLVQIRDVHVLLFLELLLLALPPPLLPLFLLLGLLPPLELPLDETLLVFALPLFVPPLPLFLPLCHLLLALHLVLLHLLELRHADGSLSLVPPVRRRPTPGPRRGQERQAAAPLDLHPGLGVVSDPAPVSEVSGLSGMIPVPGISTTSSSLFVLFSLVVVVVFVLASLPLVSGQESVRGDVWNLVRINLGDLRQRMSVVLVGDLSVLRRSRLFLLG